MIRLVALCVATLVAAALLSALAFGFVPRERFLPALALEVVALTVAVLAWARSPGGATLFDRNRRTAGVLALAAAAFAVALLPPILLLPPLWGALAGTVTVCAAGLFCGSALGAPRGPEQVNFTDRAIRIRYRFGTLDLPWSAVHRFEHVGADEGRPGLGLVLGGATAGGEVEKMVERFDGDLDRLVKELTRTHAYFRYEVVLPFHSDAELARAEEQLAERLVPGPALPPR